MSFNPLRSAVRALLTRRTAELRQSDPSLPAARLAVVERTAGRIGTIRSTDVHAAQHGVDLEDSARGGPAIDYTAPTIANVLRKAAVALEALPHPRVSPVDLHIALRKVSPTHRTGQQALDALAAHLRATGGDDQWLGRWTGPRGRDEVAAELRAAADQEARTVRARQELAARVQGEADRRADIDDRAEVTA